MKSLYPLVKQNVNQLFLFILIFCVFQSRKTWSQTSPKTFNPIYAISSSGGIQTFTVPTGVTSITITAKGAAGGNGKSTGGKGATVKATFSVASGAVLNIVVGAQGASRDDRYGGGGGGSFVSVGAFNTTNLLVAAGGGGGNGDQPGGNASTEPGSGEGGNYGNGMTGGGGGGGGINGTGGDAGYDFQGGGGGSGAPEGFEGGKSGISGTFGGYGGGGGSGYGGGGGGGYTGGNGGNESESGGGGGGGSYTKSGATAKTISIDNTGGGQVIIEWISALPSFAFSSSVQPSTCGGSDGALLFTTDLPANSYQLFYKKNGSEQSAMITVGSSNTRVAAGGGTFSLTGLGAGTYSAFKITHNGNDITLAGPYDLSDPVKPTFLVGTKVSPSTCNSTNGSIQLTGLSLSTSYGVSYQKDGGAAVTQTLVSDASGNLVIGSLGSGNYSNIKVTLKNCVSESATAVVSAPTFSMSQLSSVNPSTCGGVDGSILFSTTLPTGSYTLSYEKNGQSSSGSITVGTPSGRVGGMSATFTLSGLGAGIYGKFKILYEGCEVTLAGPYDLSDPVKPTFLVGTKVSPSTCNSTNGSIQLTGLSLSTSYGVSYQKDGGAAVTQTLVSDASGNLVIGSLGSGNYSNIKVTLKNCVSESATAVVSAPTFSMSQLSSVNPSTCGGVDGSILFSTTLPTGSYTLTYEKNGQSSSGSITVGTPSGRVGGMSATFTLSGLGAGSYGKFKILYEGCEVTLAGPYDLSDPVKPTFLVGTKVSPSTCNSTNGSIQLTGLSLSTSYGVSYQKDGGAAVTQTLVSDASGNLVIGSLGSGNYSNIKVTLKNCVSESATAVVSAPTFSMSQLSSVNPSTCGGVDGSILFSTTLPTGSYTLTYEKNGQSGSGSITVGTPSGRVGGMSATFTLSGLGAGSYGKFKILYEGCEVTLAGPYDLSDPVKPTFLVGTKVSPSTCNSTNGSIQLTGLSLSTSYGVSYQKDGGAAVTQMLVSDASGNLVIGGLGSGNYSNIKVTLKNCVSESATAVVSAPTFSMSQLSSVNPSTCGGVDGSILFSTTLPTGSYTLTYEKNGQSVSGSITVGTPSGRVGGMSATFTLSGLGAGSYGKFKILYEGCEVTLAGPYDLSEPVKPTFLVGTKVSPSTCNSTNGSIQLTGLSLSTSYGVSYQKDGGAAVTQTLVSDASGNLVIGSLGSGNYSNIKVTLKNCVSESATAVVSAPTFSMSQLSSVNPSTCGGVDGSILFSTTLPTGSYTLTYEKNGQSSSGSITVGTPSGRVGGMSATFTLSGLGAGSYGKFKILYEGCEVTLAGPFTLTQPPLATASVTGTSIVCQNAPNVPITFTGANGTQPYTFEYRVNGGSIQTLKTTGGSSTATLQQTTASVGVFTYELVRVSDVNCGQAQSGTAVVSVQGKPTITLTTLQQTLNEGNSQTFCDTDANPVNSLQFGVSSSCVSGSPVWRVQVGSGAWSDWSATAPVSQSSNNQPHRYQAACDANCSVTYTSPIELTINYRSTVPQNVSLLVDGVTVAVGETKEVCSLVNMPLTFNANCGAHEVMIYSVDGGEYSAGVPVGLVDNQYHNYRVRCRKSDGTPSCVESESGVMRLKLVTIPSAPTVSLSLTSSCNPSASFSGQSTCGSLRTVWYNATTNVALPSLPSTVPSQTTSYYARCQTENGCVSEKSNVVTFTLPPTQVAPVITASQEIVCAGTMVTISANCPAGSTTSWNTGITTPSFEVAFNNVTKQTYWAKCIFDGGCQSAESVHKDIYWNAFVVTLINIGESKSAIKTNDRAAWRSQFITRDGGPELEQSTQVNPTLYYVENANKTAPRYWTINVEACGLSTDGSLTFDMLATPEMGVIRSFNTHENNAPYFMYANREGWTELYGQNHPAYGFYQDNGAGGNVYDAGLPKGLYKLGIRYWDQKGWGSIYPSTRKPQGNVLAYQEYWFRIQSRDGVGVGAARTADSEGANGKWQGARGEGQEANGKWQGSDNGPFASVMPNPVTNVLRLKVQDSKGQVVQTSLTDASGREVVRRQFVPETNTHQEEFGVSELPTGMYFLKVTTETQQATLKVVKAP